MTEAQVQECQKKRDNADPWVRLAWDTITAYVTDKNVIPVPKNLPEALYKEQAGAFVSIHKLGELRGCIGTIAPVMPSLAEEIIRNAICAATQDPRFYPIAAKELPFLDISVDVLGAPEPISSKSELDIKRYGVIVTCGGRRGFSFRIWKGWSPWIIKFSSPAARPGSIPVSITPSSALR